MIRFIGSTTENPYFSINNAVISRVRNIYQFKRLGEEDLKKIIERALKDKDRGIGAIDISWDQQAVDI